MWQYSKQQSLILDILLILVWLENEETDTMVENAVGIRNLPDITQLAFPRRQMLQSIMKTLFGKNIE
jgi:hypothetical protein